MRRRAGTAVWPVGAIPGRAGQCRFAPWMAGMPAATRSSSGSSFTTASTDGQSRAGARPGDVDDGHHRIRRHEERHTRESASQRRRSQRQRVCEERGHGGAGHHGVGDPQQRSRGAAHHGTESRGGIGVQSARVRDAASDFGQAQAHKADEDGADQVRQHRRRSHRGRRQPGKAEDAEPTMVLTADAVRPPTPITRGSALAVDVPADAAVCSGPGAAMRVPATISPATRDASRWECGGEERLGD